MYQPEHFREDRREVLHAFIRRHPLGALVSMGAAGLTADHIPMELVARDGSDGVLRGHLARANPLWRSVPAEASVLVIFGGADRYVTPSWYATKHETGRVVPTWNYAVVHAHGRLRFIDDPAWLHGLVSGLTDAHEARLTTPWKVTDAPDDYVAQMVSAIVGFEIEIDHLTGKFKASQNRNAADREGVLAGLEADGLAADEVGELLRAPEIPRSTP